MRLYDNFARICLFSGDSHSLVSLCAPGVAGASGSWNREGALPLFRHHFRLFSQLYLLYLGVDRDCSVNWAFCQLSALPCHCHPHSIWSGDVLSSPRRPLCPADGFDQRPGRRASDSKSPAGLRIFQRNASWHCSRAGLDPMCGADLSRHHHLGGYTCGTREIVLITVAYTLGSALPMLLIAYGGNRALTSSRLLARHAEGIRQGFGLLMIVTALAIAFNYYSLLQQSSQVYPCYRDRGSSPCARGAHQAGGTGNNPFLNLSQDQTTLPKLAGEPQLTGITHWSNSPPLTMEQLRGKVVLIDFWIREPARRRIRKQCERQSRSLAYGTRCRGQSGGSSVRLATLSAVSGHATLAGTAQGFVCVYDSSALANPWSKCFPEFQCRRRCRRRRVSNLQLHRGYSHGWAPRHCRRRGHGRKWRGRRGHPVPNFAELRLRAQSTYRRRRCKASTGDPLPAARRGLRRDFCFQIDKPWLP